MSVWCGQEHLYHLQLGVLQRTVFINKIRMLQQTRRDIIYYGKFDQFLLAKDCLSFSNLHVQCIKVKLILYYFYTYFFGFCIIFFWILYYIFLDFVLYFFGFCIFFWILYYIFFFWILYYIFLDFVLYFFGFCIIFFGFCIIFFGFLYYIFLDFVLYFFCSNGCVGW